MPGKYLLTIWGLVDEALHGPFDTDEAREAKAEAFYREQGDPEEHLVFALDINEAGVPSLVGISAPADLLEDL